MFPRTYTESRADGQPQAVEACGNEELAPQISPDIVEVAGDENRRPVVEPDERMTLQKFPKLDFSLDAGEAQVEVVRVDGARGLPRLSSEPHAVARVEDAPPLLRRNGEVDVGRLGHGEAAEHGVSVLAAAADLDVGKVGAMPQPEEVTQQVYLAVGVRSLGMLIDLLQENEIRLVARDDLRYPQRIVPPIDTPDAFVDVVSDDSKAHEYVWKKSKRIMIARGYGVNTNDPTPADSRSAGTAGFPPGTVRSARKM
jgi:hypothetical protein